MIKRLAEMVIKRLTLYHFILVDFEERGLEYVSSPQIADLLGIDASQVRKDIKQLDNTGKSKIGYKVSDLKLSIEEFLGFKKSKNAFIVGAGNLGAALIKYDDLKQYGLNIIALFDSDPLKVGTTINSKEVFHISEFSELVKKFNVEIVLLTVPKEVAQDCVDYLVSFGIKYVWNFTPRLLKVNSDVKVWNENLIGNFLSMVLKK